MWQFYYRTCNFLVTTFKKTNLIFQILAFCTNNSIVSDDIVFPNNCPPRDICTKDSTTARKLNSEVWIETESCCSHITLYGILGVCDMMCYPWFCKFRHRVPFPMVQLLRNKVIAPSNSIWWIQSPLLFFIKNVVTHVLVKCSRFRRDRGSDTPPMIEKQQDKNHFQLLMWNTPKSKYWTWSSISCAVVMISNYVLVTAIHA
jgi:hypothetical protein